MSNRGTRQPASTGGRELPVPRQHEVKRPLSQLHNGLTLIGAKAIAMGLGFVFWLVAARLCAPQEVGVAAGVVSAMMLCTQLAQLGLGSAFITHYPRLKQRPSALLNTAFTLVTVLGVVWGGLFLLVAGAAFHQLNIVAARWDFAALFVVAALFGT